MSLQRALFVGDAHVPYHDKKAWRLLLKAGHAFKPDTLVVLGDLADCYSVSSHSKDPNRAFNLPQEIRAVLQALDDLDALNAGRKIFIAGNHEDRLRRYLCDKAPELFGVVSIPQLFDLKRRGWLYVEYRDHTKIGKLHLTHDIGKAGRYAAFNALDAYQHSVLVGHSHRLTYIVEGNALGEQKLSASFGWLGDARSVDYMARVNVLKNWPLGFGIGYLDSKTGYAYLVPIPIVNYTCVVEGELYRAS